MEKTLHRQLLEGQFRDYLVILESKGLDTSKYRNFLQTLDDMETGDLVQLVRVMKDLARTPL